MTAKEFRARFDKRWGHFAGSVAYWHKLEAAKWAYRLARREVSKARRRAVSSAIGLLLCSILSTGCTMTRLNTTTSYSSGMTVSVSMWRISLLQGIQWGGVEILPDGTARLTNYRNDGGGDQASKVIGAAGTAGGKILKGAAGL